MAKKQNKDRLDMEELAASFGWSYAVLNSNPELRALFKQAVKESWTEARFVAKLRNTKWYKRHGEAARKAEILKKTDPAEYKRRRQQLAARIRTIHSEMVGGLKSDNWYLKTATQALQAGWTDEEIRYYISKVADIKGLLQQHSLGGQAAETEQMIRKAVGDYGIKLSNGWISQRIRGVLRGSMTAEEILGDIRTMAKSQYRAFADQIDQGLTVRDIAEPYIQRMAQILELNPESIDVFDKKIQSALTRHDPNTGKPTTTPIWQFEQELRNDPRWLKTNNAQEALMSVGHSLLTQFGLVS